MIRGGTGHNARIREEAKAKDRQDREWLLDQVNELLAREAARDADRSGGSTEPGSPRSKAENPAAVSAHRPDETDDVWASRWDKDWEQSQKEYDRFMGR